MTWWLNEAAALSKLVRAEQEDRRRSQLVRAVQEADAKRFPLNTAFKNWCVLSAWKLEEVTALSMGIDPHIISREIIKGLGLILHPDAMKTDQDAPRLSPRARMYEDRLRYLEAACRTSEVGNAIQAGGTWEIRPQDFLAWFDQYVERYGARDPWNGLHPLFVEQVRKDHPVPSNTEKKRPCASPYADSADTADSSAGKGKAENLSFGVSKSEKGPDACGTYLRNEMAKSFSTADFNNQGEYKSHCTKKYDITGRVFLGIWTKVATETNCTWAKRGRRREAA